jgi:hypothetical protein
VKPIALLVPALLLASACSGPQAAVTIGGKALPVDVAFGLPERVVPPGATPSPRVPTTLVPAPNGVGLIEVPTSSLPGNPPSVPVITPDPIGKPLPLPVCPEPAPGVFPKTAATPVVVGLPALASYPIRYTAKVIEDGMSRTFSGNGKHQVTSASPLPGGVTTFDVAVTMLGANTTFTWSTVPAVYNALSLNTGGQIALQSATGSSGLGYEASFKPSSPVELLAQPAFKGATYTGASSDVGSGTTGQVQGIDVDHATVNACGTPVDAWRTTTTFTTSSNNQDLTTVLTTDFATANGGLPIAQTENYTGTAGGKKVSGVVTWVFSQAPR